MSQYDSPEIVLRRKPSRQVRTRQELSDSDDEPAASHRQRNRIIDISSSSSDEDERQATGSTVEPSGQNAAMSGNDLSGQASTSTSRSSRSGQLKKAPPTKRRKGEDEPSTSAAQDKHYETDDDPESNCSICFEPYTTAGSHRLCCLKCGHVFGFACIDRWIRGEKNKNCPSCKTKALVGDIRLIFGKKVQMVDNQQLEEEKAANRALKEEKSALAIQVVGLKSKVQALEKQLKEAIENQATAVVAASSKPAECAKRATMSLVKGPCLRLTGENGSRCVAYCEEGNFIVAACRMNTDMFYPFGLQKIDALTRNVVASIPLYTKRPRYCVVSPYNPDLVLSTAEDNSFCVADFSPHAVDKVYRRLSITTNGWCCDWYSATEVLIGMMSGRVELYDLRDPHKPSTDLTHGNGKIPILHVKWIAGSNTLLVASLRDVVAYRFGKHFQLIAGRGPVQSMNYDDTTNRMMVSFACTSQNPREKHLLVMLKVDDTVTCEFLDEFEGRSDTTTYIARHHMWNTSDALLAAVFDERNREIVVFDWARDRSQVVQKVPELVYQIMAIPSPAQSTTGKHFTIVALAATGKLYFIGLRC